MAKNVPHTNRLIKEKSPYLLQHAHNPVDWYPWGEEAFEAAQKEQKPIFLSIGYATCHWCHVMEKESFENSDVASLMNKSFINIKVDREELPGIDSLYMEFAQSMIAGASGWPLNVILTPDLHPFFAVTYLPPYQAHGVMGLTELITRINESWYNEEEREKLETQSQYITQLFAKNVRVKGETLLPKEEMVEAAETLFRMTDPVYGGIKGEPKFPLGYYMNFLLHYSATQKDSRALFTVERTLEMMHRGGIYDHLGGGFSRYSVDERWFLPHFEKMLYDNALLAKAYFEGWQVTKKSLYKQVCDEILHYFIRDMLFPQGGFFAAEDADSEGYEGLYYTWPYDEIMTLLGDQGELFCEFYGVLKNGNFEGRNILYRTQSLEDFAKKHAIEINQLEDLFKDQHRILLQERDKRIHPLKDTKIIAAWNGLAIDALASASDALDSHGYLAIAKKNATFIKSHFWIKNRLKRRWCDGDSSIDGGIEDYAFLIKGLLTLFEATGEAHWLEWAMQLNHITRELFKSPQGAYFQVSAEEKNIILRKCSFSDGAEPSGNSIQCENLLRLYDITGEELYLEEAEEVLKAAENYISHYPIGYIYHQMNLNRYYFSHRARIVVALNASQSYKNEIFDLLHSHFIPHKVVIWRHHNDSALMQLIPDLKDQPPLNNQTTLYICHQGRCRKPLTSFEEIQEAIANL